VSSVQFPRSHPKTSVTILVGTPLPLPTIRNHVRFARTGAINLCPKANAYTLIHQPVMRLVGAGCYKHRCPTTIQLLSLVPAVAYTRLSFSRNTIQPLSFRFLHYGFELLTPRFGVFLPNKEDALVMNDT
jgi:hypothetical protein